MFLTYKAHYAPIKISCCLSLSSIRTRTDPWGKPQNGVICSSLESRASLQTNSLALLCFVNTSSIGVEFKYTVIVAPTSFTLYLVTKNAKKPSSPVGRIQIFIPAIFWLSCCFPEICGSVSLWPLTSCLLLARKYRCLLAQTDCIGQVETHPPSPPMLSDVDPILLWLTPLFPHKTFCIW